MKHDTARGIQIGIVTMVVIFVVLCLSIFSVLSLTTARQELALAQRSAEATAAYWAGDKALCDKVNEVIAAHAAKGDAGVQDWARENGAQCVEEDGVLTLVVRVGMDANNDLYATLAIHDTVQVLSWRQVAVGPWEPDLSIPVWQGDSVQ